MKTYYVWSGVGPIWDLDGEEPDQPAAADRGEAWEVFRALARVHDVDLTLWERDGVRATLLAVVTGSVADGTRCFSSFDPVRNQKPPLEEKK